MKNILIFIIAVFGLLFTSCQSVDPNQYIIEGTVPAGTSQSQKIYLQTLSDDWTEKVILDTTRVKDGKFRFKGIVENPRMAYISAGRTSMKVFQYEDFVLEPGRIQVEFRSESEVGAKVIGQVHNNNYGTFKERLNSELNEQYLFYEQLRSDSTLEGDKRAIRNSIDSFDVEINILTYSFIENNISTEVGAYLLVNNSHEYELEELSKLVELIPERFEKQSSIITFKDRVTALDSTKVGAQYIDIDGVDLNGKDVALSDYIGKNNRNALIRFWASWCSECSENIAQIAAIQRQYKYRRLDVVSISLDVDAKRWAEASRNLGIYWPQLSDLKGWKSNSSRDYGISQVPYFILINSEGEILAREKNLDKMTKKVEDLLK